MLLTRVIKRNILNKRYISYGEKKCIDVLDSINIKFVQQYKLPFLKNRRYDFMFHHNEEKYILEYDGQQHFHYVKFFHKYHDDAQ